MNPINNDSQTPFGGGSIPSPDASFLPQPDQGAQADAFAAVSNEPAAQVSQPSDQTQLNPVASALADIPGLAASQPSPVSDPAASLPQAPAGQSGSLSQHSPKIAEDVDLIEKEWVTKAKAIIDKTRGNPNEQTKELSRFKADYLKTRYSKDVKVNE